jgi:hypothetical protein
MNEFTDIGALQAVADEPLFDTLSRRKDTWGPCGWLDNNWGSPHWDMPKVVAKHQIGRIVSLVRSTRSVEPACEPVVSIA